MACPLQLEELAYKIRIQPGPRMDVFQESCPGFGPEVTSPFSHSLLSEHLLQQDSCQRQLHPDYDQPSFYLGVLNEKNMVPGTETLQECRFRLELIKWAGVEESESSK